MDVQENPTYAENSGIRTALIHLEKQEFINAFQIQTFFTEMGSVLSKEEINDLIYEFDHEGRGGVLDKKEFLALVSMQLEVEDTEEEVIDAFKLFDKDMNGFLDCGELRRIMIYLGDQLTNDEVDKIIIESDLDGDGSVNYEEFTRIMMAEKKLLTKSAIDKLCSRSPVASKKEKGSSADRKKEKNAELINDSNNT